MKWSKPKVVKNTDSSNNVRGGNWGDTCIASKNTCCDRRQGNNW